MSSTDEDELIDSLKLQSETSLRRISRMIEFMRVVRKTESQILRSLEEDTGEDPGPSDPAPPRSQRVVR